MVNSGLVFVVAAGDGVGEPGCVLCCAVLRCVCVHEEGERVLGSPLQRTHRGLWRRQHFYQYMEVPQVPILH